jgi:predicted nucleic acid-binding protein
LTGLGWQSLRGIAEHPKFHPSAHFCKLFVTRADVLAESATLVFPTDRATGATSDPNDEMILECALAGEVDYIVSGDKKHLLSLGQFRGIRIVNPAEFVRIVELNK